jgi:hypothetical protein
VYVTDSQHNPKTTFEPGDGVAFHVDVENTTQGTFPIDVRFEWIDNDNWWSGNYSYGYTQHVDAMPVGLSRFYNPTTIPANAYNGRYSVRVSITPTNSASPTNDGDWGEGDFRIFSTTNVNPINDRIKTLQNGAMCAGDIVSLGADSLLLESVKVGADAMGFSTAEADSSLPDSLSSSETITW